MQHVDIDDVDSQWPMSDAVDRRGLSDPLDTSDLAMNHYAIPSGEAFSGGMHAHLDQEEVFYVLEGTATFETKTEPTAESETVEVSAGESIRFAPGEFQQGRNEGEDDVVALALGAPKGSTEVHVPEACRNCGDSEVLAFGMDEDGTVLECPECGTEIRPET